jgi:hypothetical protein
MPANQIKGMIASKFPDITRTLMGNNENPIQIQAPDGSIAEFPDGTTDGVIKSVMARYFGGPSGGGDSAPKGPRYLAQTPDTISAEPRSPQPSKPQDGPWTKYQQPNGDKVPLNIEGHRVYVDRGFLSLAPEEQGKAVDEIAQSLGIQGTAKKFDITAPDGRKFRVTGKDAEGALSALRKHLGDGADNTDVLSKIRTASGGMLEGIPVVGPMIRGGVERLAAASIAPFSDKDYSQVLSEIQKMDEGEKAANPILDTASQVAGAIGGTVPMVMAAPAAFGAGGGGLLARTIASGASGAALGGADSAVRSRGDLAETGFGTLAGLATGAAAPIAGRAIGSGWQRLRDFRATKAAAKAAGIDRGALFTLGRAVRDDGMDAATIGQRMNELGPDAMLMDAGPNLQRQAGALAATPGRGQEIVRSAIANRQAGAGARIGDALDTVLGQPADTLALADDIVSKRASAARPLYAKAYEEGSDGVWSPELQRMAGSPMFADAMRRAASTGQDRAILDGFGSFNPRVTVTQDGRITFNRTRPGGSPLYPDLQYWDYVKRNLDDIAGEAKRAGRTEQASVAANLASRLRGELDKAVPSYRAARDAYAGPSAILDAMDEGQEVFRNSYTPGQLKQRLSAMSEGERDAFIQGARAQIAHAMGTARNDATAARAMFQKGYNRDKLEMLVGKGQADQMLKALDAETAFTRTRDIVTGNSETAARSAAMREISGDTGPRFGVREGYMAGGLLGGARSAGMRTIEKIAESLSSTGREARNAGLANAITNKDYDAIVKALEKAQGRKVNSKSIETIARALLVGGGTAAARP